MKKIDYLASQGIISKIMGKVSNNISLALVVQARSRPKDPFKAFIAVSQILSNKPLNVYVDNLYSQIFFGRTEKEQNIIDNEYKKFFEKLDCKVFFSRDIFQAQFNAKILFSYILDCANLIPFSELVLCMPLEKRKNIKELKLDEILHLMMEFIFIEEIIKKHNLLLFGQGSQAIVSFCQRRGSNPFSSIILPHFSSSKDVDNYLEKIKQIT